VPHRACFHPPLLNAVFVAASRLLLASKKHKASDGRTVLYQGQRLDRLNDDMCYRYLHAVIAYLKRATTADHLCDVRNLAAAVLLRFASDFQRSITGEEEDRVDKTYQSFIRARAYAMANGPASPPNHQNWMQSSHSPHNNQASFQFMQKGDKAWGRNTLLSFEHACNRVALRQEILATIMHISRPKEGRATINAEFTLPPTWDALGVFPAQKGIEDDFVWADKHLCHLAEVLRFHIDNNPHSRADRFRDLRQYQIDWDSYKPYSFAPYRDQPQQDPPFPHRAYAAFALPTTWLLGEVNLIGNQYISLARIVLMEADPNPSEGRNARNKHVRDIRELVLKICGMANSSKSMFAKEIAYAAITFCVPHFQSHQEQEVLLGVVQKMETEFGWPIASKMNALLGDYGRHAEAEAYPIEQRQMVDGRNGAMTPGSRDRPLLVDDRKAISA
jgi:hypothetical protein